MNNELTYWLSFSLIQGITRNQKNKIYVQECHNKQRSLVDFYNDIDSSDLKKEEKEIIGLSRAGLPQIAFQLENLISQGYNVIPFTAAEYPSTLKKNLGTNAPTVLFAKGDIKLLNEPTLAIVGSRKADQISLTFTDNIARKAAKDNNVVVSGFAKGIDRQALDSSINYGGKSIIVLPQGILTFNSGFRQYYKSIISGQVLVISEFAPNAGWSVGSAMARNHTIYGLAEEIFVAQSDSKGGTFEGVQAGLKKNRQIYVRRPEIGEKMQTAF